MPSCQMCKAIPENFLEDFCKLGMQHSYAHHPSLTSLELAGQNGCNFCFYIWDYFTRPEYWGGSQVPKGIFPDQKYCCEDSTYNIAFFKPPLTTKGLEEIVPAFSVLLMKEEFVLAYRFGLGGENLRFHIIKAGNIFCSWSD